MVYGAGSIGPGWGNGKAAAVLFAREGARVLCIDRNEAAARETAGLIAAEGGTAHVCVVDITAPDAATEATARCTEHLGIPDIVHYNVGTSQAGGIDEGDLDGWRAVFAVNVEGAMLAASAALPAMVSAKKGAFVFISSLAAVASGGYQYASYEASKAALNRLSQTIAVAHAADGIRSNVIMPGLIDTPHVLHVIAGHATPAADLAARRAAAPPMRRQGTPFEVAEAAVFLASDAASYITGATLPVDGGLSLTVRSA